MSARIVSEAARALAAKGWPVFPCRVGGKEPATTNGFHNASTDPSVIAEWFRRLPDANLATVTGELYDVLDFDVKPSRGAKPALDSRPLFDKLNRARLLAGCLGTALTRNGGYHLYYPKSGAKSGSLPSDGLDFKAAGGYVLVPPSKVASDFAPDLDGGYRWIDFPDEPSNGQPLNWQAIRRYLHPELATRSHSRSARRGPGSADGLLRTVREAPEGGRNNALNWAAFKATRDGLLTELRPELLAAAIAAGLPRSEAERTIASAEQAGVVA